MYIPSIRTIPSYNILFSCYRERPLDNKQIGVPRA